MVSKILDYLKRENKNILDILEDETNELRDELEYDLFNTGNPLEYKINLQLLRLEIDGEIFITSKNNIEYKKIYEQIDKKNIIAITNLDDYYKEKIKYLDQNDYYVLLISDNHDDLKLKYDFEKLFVLINDNPLNFVSQYKFKKIEIKTSK